jgi:hypothetical protein
MEKITDPYWQSVANRGDGVGPPDEANDARQVWATGQPSWRCANCGRANIYHDPRTGACPQPEEDEPRVS